MSSTQKSTEVTTDSLQDGQATISSPVNTVEKKNVTNEPQQHPSNTSSKTVPSLTSKEATSSKAVTSPVKEAEPLISSSSPPKSSNIQNTNPFRRSSIFEPLQKSSILPEEPALYNNSAIKRNERILRCEQRILSNEWDTKAWLGILKESLSSSVDTGRFYFDCFFRRFPLSPCKLKEYIDFELQRGNVGVVQNIFQKHLKSSANIELWRCYLHFVDTQNEGLEQMEYRAVMLKAFNFALENVSIDISSTVIYRDYIEFIKKWKPEVAFDESQKILMLRQIYHEAIKNPIYQLEALWSEYEAFERGVGGQILMERKFREELTASYMLARSALVERTSRLEKIVRNVLSVPVADSAKERQQVKLWKEYIDWEKKNSLKLDLKDLQKRVIFTYKQCLQCYSFHSDIWLQYASFLDGQHDACAAVFQQALQINPTSFLIAFSYAEYEERHGNNELAKNIYENLAARNDIDPTLVYVQFMKFAKRVYGMDKVREIFRGARKDGRCTYHIWIANASLEHHFGKAEFANKVFALGRQKCATDKEFLFKYIDYLAFYKCHNEIEVLYRQMLRTFSPVHLDEIWSRYMRFVVNHFPLQIINRVEKDYLVYKESKQDSRMAVTIERYRYLDLLPCSGLECKFFGVSPAMEATTARDGSQKADAAVHDVSMPDTQQMIKFNPEAECTTPEYLAPLSVLQLMKFTSPRGPTRDPLVDVDELLAVLRRIELPSMSDNKKRGQDQLGLDTSSASNLFMSRRRKVANL